MIKTVIGKKKTLITYTCMIFLILLSVYTRGLGSIAALAIFMLFATNATTTETLNILYMGLFLLLIFLRSGPIL